MLTNEISAASCLSLLHLGDLLRDEAAKPESPYATQLQEIMREGRLVPDDIVLALLQVSNPPLKVFLQYDRTTQSHSCRRSCGWGTLRWLA